MEADLDTAICLLSRLELLDGAIVCSNLSFQYKMSVLISLIHLYGAGLEKQTKE